MDDTMPSPPPNPQPTPNTRLMTPTPTPWPLTSAPQQGFYFTRVGEAYEAFDAKAWALQAARKVLQDAHAKLHEMLHAELRHRLPATVFTETVAEVMAGLVDLDADTTKLVIERQDEAQDWIEDPRHKRELARWMAS